MHDVTGSHWHEPEGTKNAGYGEWKRPNTAYDDFMESQGIPVYRAIGVRRVQDLPLAPWKRVDDMQASLPAKDRARVEQEGGVMSRAEYEKYLAHLNNRK